MPPVSGGVESAAPACSLFCGGHAVGAGARSRQTGVTREVTRDSRFAGLGALLSPLEVGLNHGQLTGHLGNVSDKRGVSAVVPSRDGRIADSGRAMDTSVLY